ncbi:MAG TPA: UDP-N-acetylglucosamine 2-epimerase (non-hydrolyzing) [Clostridiales bacterium]|nr:MAG: UDP-N-acetylglucosamine 2-epimerase [Clostridiales bacterium GWD2_32_59]HAN10226.1 UDP-N-acetylglucosamine 2-epimerase (non-hydrolyzing) [Clostridiales bacterium]
MKKYKVMSVFGTRPEAIKMVPVIKELEKCDGIESIVCVTAQHREMLDQVLEIFDIKPNYDLDVMKDRQTLTGVSVRILEKMDVILNEEKPDLILIQGDTATVLMASIAAFYNKIKVGHIEAGLRTYNKYEPFPEEMNRKLTGCIADIHFAPTENAKQNLLKENVDNNTIYVTGNTSIDVLAYTIRDGYTFKEEVLNKIDYKNKKVIVMTAHRRENLGEPLVSICEAALKLANDNKDVEVVYAVHKNPAVQEVARKVLGDHAQIHLIEPLDIEDMHNLMSKCYLVMTDSGGIQEEVPSLGKPVLVLRNVTERPEGVEAGTLKLVGTDKEVIVSTAQMLINDGLEYEKMAQAKNPFGDGTAGKQIVEIIKNYKGS